MFPHILLGFYAIAVSLFGGTNAQSLKPSVSVALTTESSPSTTKDSLNSETGSISLASPTGTGAPCARIASAVKAWRSSASVSVAAELAYNCLASVPLKRNAAVGTIDSLEKLVPFQSNLAYLRKPPDGYQNPPVDVLAGLADIRDKVSGSGFANQLEFEAAIASLLGSARDGHLGFEGPTYAGAVRWRRDLRAILIATSVGAAPPDVYSFAELNYTSTPSPIIKIDGQDVKTFLQKEADYLAFHDADARWNALFYRLPAQSFGTFISPQQYPGPTTTLTFENGTEQVLANRAILRQKSRWSLVSDGETFYSTFVDASAGVARRRDLSLESLHIPQRLQPMRETIDDGSADTPQGFPEPWITGPTEVFVNGYFISIPTIDSIAVLALQTFDTKTDADARRFQSVVERFLAQAKSRGTTKVIIDIQSNPGGRVFLGLDTALQFFPNIEPYLASRYRVHDSAEVFGKAVSRLSFSQSGFGYTSPFNYHSFISSTNKRFDSWEDMSDGPTGPAGDKYTKTLRYNLSDPYVTTSSTWADGITPTGHGDRSNFTTPPFLPQDIILLGDGICGSTCSQFVDFMTIQAGVKIVVVGGRPQPGPMQPVGATKGSNVLTADYFATLSEYLVGSLAANSAEAQAWQKTLPGAFPIQASEASVNFLDAVREGNDDGGPPAQFSTETANCRLWYSPGMMVDVRETWRAAAAAAWGGLDGGMDEAKCVEGSFRRESFVEKPPVVPVFLGSEGKEGEAGSKNGASAKEGKSVTGGAGASVVAVAVHLLHGQLFVTALVAMAVGLSLW